jgi:hypothetical protein
MIFPNTIVLYHRPTSPLPSTRLEPVRRCVRRVWRWLSVIDAAYNAVYRPWLPVAFDRSKEKP